LIKLQDIFGAKMHAYAASLAPFTVYNMLF